ncbi:MAG: hypothetical protein K8U57_36060 [Planctomycetes bacterium]|nr:hypothetical protein [Planctomycetota bacterium]
MSDGSWHDIASQWFTQKHVVQEAHQATITPDEQVKITDFIRTRGVTLCPPAAAIGAFDPDEEWGDREL